MLAKLQGGVLTSVVLGLQQQKLVDLPPLRLCIIFGSGPSRYPPHQVRASRPIRRRWQSSDGIGALCNGASQTFHGLMPWYICRWPMIRKSAVQRCSAGALATALHRGATFCRTALSRQWLLCTTKGMSCRT